MPEAMLLAKLTLCSHGNGSWLVVRHGQKGKRRKFRGKAAQHWEFLRILSCLNASGTKTNVEPEKPHKQQLAADKDLFQESLQLQKKIIK